MLNMTLLLHVAGVPDLLAVICEDQLGLVHLLVGDLVYDPSPKYSSMLSKLAQCWCV